MRLSDMLARGRPTKAAFAQQYIQHRPSAEMEREFLQWLEQLHPDKLLEITGQTGGRENLLNAILSDSALYSTYLPLIQEFVNTNPQAQQELAQELQQQAQGEAASPVGAQSSTPDREGGPREPSGLPIMGLPVEPGRIPYGPG